MKLVFFSDLHTHSWPEHNPEKRLQECISVLTEIREYCIDHGIRDVFFGGDMFHKRGVLFTRAYAQVTRELWLFKKKFITFYAVDGNHDHEDREGQVHALQPLMDGGLVQGIDCMKGWRNIDRGEVVVSMFSYNDSYSELKRRVRAAAKDATDDDVPHISLFHHGFKGARVGSTLEFVVKEPISAKKLKLDTRFDLNLCGHYHAHQRIKGLKNGWYIGSPLEHTRCDYSDDEERFKGFLVVDTDDVTNFERVPLNRPRFLKLSVSGEFEFEPDLVRGNFVDLHYGDTAMLQAMQHTLEGLGARAVKPIPLPKAKTTTKKRLDVDPTLEPKQVLKRYLKYKRKEAQEVPCSRKELISMGLELLHEAGQE